MTRRFEFHGHGSNKFWEIETVLGAYEHTIILRWGRIGTNGQTKRLNYRPHRLHALQQEVDRRIASKLRKGYYEVARHGMEPPSPVREFRRKAKPPKKPKRVLEVVRCIVFDEEEGR